MPDTQTQEEMLTFSFVPRLRHLLPKMRGLPGYEYLQVSTKNMRRAQNEGWRPVEGTYIYSIQGPKGIIDVSLFVRGARIPGVSHDSGARRCYVDRIIFSATGLPDPSNELPEPTVSETPKESTKNARPSQNST